MLSTLRYVLSLHVYALFPLKEHSAHAQRTPYHLLRHYVHPEVRNGHLTLTSLRDQRIAHLVYALKYERHGHSTRVAAQILADAVQDEVDARGETESRQYCICTLPPTDTRETNEQYDQLDALAKAIQRYYPIPYHENILRWTVGVERQSRMTSSAERHENIQGAMAAEPFNRNAVHIVIDDVSTTGTSLSEARRALTEAGVKDVVTLALARA